MTKKKQRQIEAQLLEASQAFLSAAHAARTLAELMGPEELVEPPTFTQHSAVRVLRVDPETEGPVPTVLAHFPIPGAQWGYFCSCKEKDGRALGEAFPTARDWAEHLVANLWPVMSEEPF